MSGHPFIGGAVRTLSSAKARIGGSLRTLTRGVAYKSDAIRPIVTFTLPLAASASPSDVFGSVSGFGGQTVTSGYTTVTPTGGLAPFTYNWPVGSGMTPTNPTNATTAFSKFLLPGQDLIADAPCTVTDALGSTAIATVGVYLINEGS